MGFDFSGVMQQAKDLTDRSEGSAYRYKLFYPGIGKTTVKLLFNPASNSVVRLVNRHTIMGDKAQKVPCLRTWNKKCPICDTLEAIKNATGSEMYKMKSKPRGISFAQFIETTAPVDEKSPKQGDIVLFMYPWKIYQAINNLISELKTQEQVESVIGRNESLVFIINRTDQNDYTATISPYQKFSTCDSEEEFQALLEGMESLSDQVLPGTLTDDIINQVNEIAEDMKARYLSPSLPRYETKPSVNPSNMNQGASYFASGGNQSQNYGNSYNSYQAANNSSFQSNQQVSSYQQRPDDDIPFDSKPSSVSNPVNSGGSTKECFGKFNENDYDKCLTCREEFDCRAATKVQA